MVKKRNEELTTKRRKMKEGTISYIIVLSNTCTFYYVHVFYYSLTFPHSIILSDLLALESRESEHYATVAAEVEAQRLMKREVTHQTMSYL